MLRTIQHYYKLHWFADVNGLIEQEIILSLVVSYDCILNKSANIAKCHMHTECTSAFVLLITFTQLWVLNVTINHLQQHTAIYMYMVIIIPAD